MNSKRKLTCLKLIPVFARNHPFFQKYFGSAKNDHIVIIGIAMTGMMVSIGHNAYMDFNIGVQWDLGRSKGRFAVHK